MDPGHNVPAGNSSGSDFLAFAGQSEGHSITECYCEAAEVMSRDQNALTPFLHCPCPGDGQGFIEPPLHTETGGRGDCDREVTSGFHGSNFSCLDYAGRSQELPLAHSLPGVATADFQVICFLLSSVVATDSKYYFNLNWCRAIIGVSNHLLSGLSLLAKISIEMDNLRTAGLCLTALGNATGGSPCAA